MTVVSNLFFFVIALGILVTFHEFGHFWVARRLGVKVLTFSVGFGKALWRKKGKDGVNYVIAAIPLGGYVKMLDEREGDVSEADLPYAFNRKSVWARMAIVLAGPVANFILAIAFYWLMFGMGINDYSTQMGQIPADSIAGRAGVKAGDYIVAVDDKPVFGLQDVNKAIARRIGEKSQIELSVIRENQNTPSNIQLDLADWQVDSSQPAILESLGLHQAIEDLPAVIDSVTPQSPADKAGLLPGDIFREYNGKKIKNWSDLVTFLKPDADKKAQLLIERKGELVEISVVIGSHKPEGEAVGFIGVSYARPDISKYFVTRKGGFLESFELAIYETGDMIGLSVQLFKKLLIGDISPKSLSGPISIAEGAGGSARGGLVSFLSFVAMISVNLGFINLLPIPLLDGGHLLFFSFEAIKGKPLSERVQEIGMQIGMMLVFTLMAIAIFNDLSRL